MNKTRKMETIEKETGKDIKELLWHRYVEEGFSQQAIAKQLGVSISTIWLWLFKLGIPARQWQHPQSRGGSV